MIFIDSNKRTQVLKYVFLALAILYTFVFVVFGFGNYMDPFYWMSMYERYDVNSYMYCGTIALGYVWMKCFGATVFSMRVLGWLLSVVSLAMPYFFLLEKTVRRKNVHWLAFAYCLLGYAVFQEFSPGSLSVFFISLLSIVLVKYFENRKYVAFIPLVMALAIVSRFPNVVLLLFMPLIVLINGFLKKQKAVKVCVDECVVIVGTIVSSLLFYIMLGVDTSYDNLRLGFNQEAQGNHSISVMIELLISNIMTLVYDVGVVLVVLFGLAINRHSKSWRKWILPCVFAFCVFAYMKYKIGFKEWYNIHLHYFISSLTIAFGLHGCVRGIIEKKSHTTLVILSLLLIGAVVPLGSNTAWLKLFPMYLCFLPFIVIRFFSPSYERSYIYPTMAVICACSMAIFFTNPIGDYSIMDCRVSGTQPLYSGVYIPKEVDDYLNDVVSDCIEYGEKGNTVAVGYGAHLFHQLTHCNNIDYNDFWMRLDDTVFFESVRNQIEKNHPVVFCMSIPCHVDGNLGSTYFEKKLKEMGYCEVKREADCYTIYVQN